MAYTAESLVREIARMDPEAPDYEETLRTLIGEARRVPLYVRSTGETEAILRDLIEAALDASIDKCARCKVCGNQVDAVMAAITGGPPGGLPVMRELAQRPGPPGAYDLGTRAPLTGAEFTYGAYDGEEFCGCGEPITYFEGEWMHIVSEQLRGTGDHAPEPLGGFYIPGGMDEEDLSPWLVTTALGTRTWQAVDEQHAREQHADAFPDEEILDAGEAER